jgi:hypothetical protein
MPRWAGVDDYLENAIDACRSTSTFHYLMWVPCDLKNIGNTLEEIF